MTTTINSACVYCGTGSGATQEYRDAAAAVGRALAADNVRLVYGGGRVGLMGIVAENCMDSGGQVTGIIPEHIQQKEQTNIEVTELHIVASMHERKMMMAQKSDAFIVLPGGFGTLDEAFEILTWKYLGLHDKPVVFVNVQGYFDRLFDAMRHMVGQGFTPAWHMDMFKVTERADQVIPLLRSFGTSHLKTDTKHM